MSLLTIITEAINAGGFDSQAPSSIIGSNAPIAKQSLSLLKLIGKELLRDPHDWQVLEAEQTFVLDGSGSYPLSTVFPDGDYEKIINSTEWDTTTAEGLIPVNAVQWQAINNSAIGISSFAPYFRLQGNNLLITPDTSGETITLEYLSNFWITDSTGATGKADFTSDDDLVKFPEDLLVLGLIYRLKVAKGLDATADFAFFEDAKDTLKGQDKPVSPLGISTIRRFPNRPEGNYG